LLWIVSKLLGFLLGSSWPVLADDDDDDDDDDDEDD
jgi:hypothetical protein